MIRSRVTFGIGLVAVSLILATAAATAVSLIYLVELSFDTVVFVAGTLWILQPSVAVIGLLGAYLVESARGDSSQTRHTRWTRERSVLVSACVAEAVLIGTGLLFGFLYLPDAVAQATAFRVVVRTVLTLSLSMYLFWTAERFTRTKARSLGTAAMTLAIFSAALEPSLLGYIFPAASALSTTTRPLLVAGLGFGVLSLVLWILLYTLVLPKTPGVRGSSPSSGGA